MAKFNMREMVKQKAKEAEFSGGSDYLRLKEGTNYFKPKKDKNEIIIVPFAMSGPRNDIETIPSGMPWYRYQIYKHFNIGAEGKAYICPRTIGKRCPICEYRKTLLDQGALSDSKEVSALKTSKRDLYNVIDLSGDGEDVSIWEVTYGNFGELLDEEIRAASDDSIIPSFADPDEGAILTVRMSEETYSKTKYFKATRIDFVERGEPLTPDILEQAVEFGTSIIIKPYDELKAVLFDEDDEDDNEPEESHDDVPAKKPSRFTKRTATESKEYDTSPQDAFANTESVKPSEDTSDNAPVTKKLEKKPEAKATGHDSEIVCPSEKGTFGVSYEDPEVISECDQCEYWVECEERVKELKAAQKQSGRK